MLSGVCAIRGSSAPYFTISGSSIRDEELRAARIALPAGAAAQLVVDPPALVPVRADHVQTAELRDAWPELDVDAAAGHVRGDRDGAPRRRRAR